MSSLVFVDVETTGLDPARDEVWEFAAIRREENGTEAHLHLFVEHDPAKARALPDPFRADLEARFPADKAVSPWTAASKIARFTSARHGEKVRLVGACPWFDAGHLTALLTRHRFAPSWSHRLIDVETLAAGKAGRLMNGLADAAATFGIENPAAHTAMADAETAMRVFDAVMGGDR